MPTNHLTSLYWRALIFLLATILPYIIATNSPAERWPPQNHEDFSEVYCADGVFNFSNSATKEYPLLGIRVANGGGGQAGIVGALAVAYLKEKMPTLYGKTFCIGWRATNTTYSLAALKEDRVDIAIVYDFIKEKQALEGFTHNGLHTPAFAADIAHVWMDHFLYIGPLSNPAGLGAEDSPTTAIDKIIEKGVWLSRADKSAINMMEEKKILERVNALRHKQKHLVKPITIDDLREEGTRAAFCLKTPSKQDCSCANTHCKGFYQVVHSMPLEAVANADRLGYYTQIDQGSYLSTPSKNRLKTKIFIDGSKKEHQPYMLNPADALLTLKPYNRYSQEFFTWLQSSGAQKIIASYTGKDFDNKTPLYEPAWHDYAEQRLQFSRSFKFSQNY